MEARVLVAVLLVLSTASALDPASAERVCGTLDKIVRNESTEVISSNAVGINLSTMMFVKPGSDFTGISIKINQENERYVAWFPTDRCLPASIWAPLSVEVKIISSNWHTIHCFIHFELKTDSCIRNCYKQCWCQHIGGLSIVAHGPSSWRTDIPPNTCPVKVSERPPPSTEIPPCRESPHPATSTANPSFRQPSGTTTTTTTTTTTNAETTAATPTLPFSSPAPKREVTSPTSLPTPVVVLIIVPTVVVVVSLVVSIAVVVVVVRRMRQRRSATSHTEAWYCH